MFTSMYNVKVCKNGVLISNQNYDQLKTSLNDYKLHADFFSKYIMLYFKKYFLAFNNNLKYNKLSYLEHDIILNNNTVIKFYFCVKNNKKIINCIINVNDLQYLKFRDTLYDIFIYNLDITDCIWYILSTHVKEKRIKNDKLSDILIKTYCFFQYYNNNYRPIYHLEKYLFYLIKTN